MSEQPTAKVPLPALAIGKAYAARHPELGRLADLGGWFASCAGTAAVPGTSRLLVVTGDHAAAREVTSRPALDLAGPELPDWLTRQEIEPPADVSGAFDLGRSLAAAEADAGTELLLVAHRGRGNSTVSAAIVGVLGASDAATVTGRGLGIDDTVWMRKAALVRDLMRVGRARLADPIGLLEVLDAPVAALTCGLLLEAGVRRTPVLLDGFPAAAAGLVAHRLDYRAPRWWFAAGCSAEPGHRMALDRLDLAPLLDLGIRRDDGLSAILAATMLRAALNPEPG